MKKKYVFAGNRSFVYERMTKIGLDIIRIYAVKNSYFEKFLKSMKMEYQVIENKEELVNDLANLEFDVFVANGLPIILPISLLTKNNTKKFINIHPSQLPDLRGADPVPGALLYGKNSGATCHYMNDGIDTGDIIAQISIDNTKDLDAGLLYQLSFIAEADVFEKAYLCHFEKAGKQTEEEDNIYYTFKESDLEIDLQNATVNEIVRKVKAFSNPSKGAYVKYNGKIIKVYDIDILENQYLNSLRDRYQDLEIVFQYESTIILKKENQFVRLKQTNILDGYKMRGGGR